MSSVPPSPPYPPPPGSPGPGGGGPSPQLVRRRDDKVIAGVCSGIARHFGIDPVLIRIGAVILAFTGWGVLAYLVAWCVLPEERPDGSVRPASANPGWPWLPIVLVLALFIALPAGFGLLFGGWGGNWGPAPLFIVMGVVFLVWRSKRGHGSFHHRGHRGHRGPGWMGPPPPSPPGGSSAPTTPSPWGEHWVDDPEPAVTSPAPAASPAADDNRPEWARYDESTTNSAAPAVPTAPAGAAGEQDDEEDALLAEARRLADPLQTEPFLFETAPTTLPAPAPSPIPPRRRGGRRAILATFLIGLGVVVLVASLASAGWFALAAGVLMALAAALIVGGVTGGGRALIFPALVVLGILSFGSAVNLSGFDLSTGERNYQPSTLAELDESYSLGAGELTIDLSDIDFAGAERTVEASVGLGELTVIVPDDVAVDVEGSAGAGSVILFGDESGGIGVDGDAHQSGTPTGGQLTLDVRVGMGEVTVDRAEAGTVVEGSEAPEAPEGPEALGRPERPGGS